MRIPLPELVETDSLFLTRLQPQDAESVFYSYASKPEATQYVSWPTHKTLDDTRKFLAYAQLGWRRGVDYSYGIRVKETNRFIGSFGVMNEEGKVQFGYILSPTHWGNGHATEVCLHMMGLLRQIPEIYRIGTLVDIDNAASIKVLQKAGLVEEARLAKWLRFVNQGNQPKDCFIYRLP